VRSEPEGSIKAPHAPHTGDPANAFDRKSAALLGFCRAL
jgi:hypothetical protein